jgi:hypothetical protein
MENLIFGSISANEISIWRGDSRLGYVYHNQGKGDGNLYFTDNNNKVTKLGKAQQGALHNAESIKLMLNELKLV